MTITTPTTEEVYEADRLEEMVLGSAAAHIAAINHNSEVEAITWEKLETACLASPVYQLLHQAVQAGVSDNSQDWDIQLKEFFPHRHSLTTLGPVVLLYDRPVIPASLQQRIMEILHAAHGGCNMMFSRASSSLYWPRFREHINKFQAACKTCRQIAPSNPRQPSTQKPDIPSYPFESIVADFFSLEGRNYLAVADRYSNWLSVIKLVKDDSPNLIQALREYITYFGIPRLLSSDAASIFTSGETEDFCKRWGIEQRFSSNYHPVSNKRAEVAVKSSKRLVRDNLNSDGSLNCDRFARALLIHRNTPDPVTGVSPAQILFGRQLRDHIPTPPHKFALQGNWEQAAKLREQCFMQRHYAKCEDLSTKTKPLQPLIPGDQVYIQDQTGKTPRQWNKSGKVLEVLPHDSYLLRVDGSYRTTRRNRRFLRKFTPHNQPFLTPQDQTIVTDSLPHLALQQPLHSPVNPAQPGDHFNEDHQQHDDQGPAHHDGRDEGLPQEDEDPYQHVSQENSVGQEANVSQEERSTPPLPTQNATKPSTRVTPARMRNLPKHLREEWVLTEHPETTNKEVPQQQLKEAAQVFMQACLEVLQFNLSQTCIGGGSITRI